jgi:hypothetical protein
MRAAVTPDKRIYLAVNCKVRVSASPKIGGERCASDNLLGALCAASWENGSRWAIMTWNSESRYVIGKIAKAHFKEVEYKGHMHRGRLCIAPARMNRNMNSER